MKEETMPKTNPEYTIKRKLPDEKELSGDLCYGTAEDVLTWFVKELNDERLNTEAFYRIYKNGKMILREGS
jgi:hypothetical protein